MKQKCKNCNEEFVGRSDKKFCSDQCRNSFNNKLTRENEKVIISINQILRRNRKILKQLNPVGKSTVRRDYLEKLEFNFVYFTQLFCSKNGNSYKICYDYGYLELEDDKILIVQWKDF